MPTSPNALNPQQYAALPAVSPQVCRYAPASTLTKLTPPATGVGVVRTLSVPSPSWPSPLAPQQYAALLVVTPQACSLPTVTWTKSSAPATRLGANS